MFRPDHSTDQREINVAEPAEGDGEASSGRSSGEKIGERKPMTTGFFSGG